MQRRQRTPRPVTSLGLTQFSFDLDENGVAVVLLNVVGERVNMLSHAVAGSATPRNSSAALRPPRRSAPRLPGRPQRRP